MKIVSPNDSSHSIDLIMRRTDIPAHTVAVLRNETTKVEFQISDITGITTTDGVTTLAFTTEESELVDKTKYELKIYCRVSDEVFFRGKILATTQETQDYKLTKDLYFYE